jgi:hypothetical protein
MGLLDSIKQDAKKSGQSKGKFIYFREGQKVRIRFLQDMDDGLEILFHDSYEQGVNVPCQEIYGKDCPYCNDDSLRTRKQYCWSVWDYENKEVKLFMFPVNNCTPIPALVAMYENYGTITDRDYVISVSGKQQNKTFSVVPMDKVKFRNDKAKAYSTKAVLQLLDKAYPCDATSDSDIDDDDDEDEAPKKKSKSSKPDTKKKGKQDDDDEDDDLPFGDGNDDDDEEDEDEDETDYEDMSVKELFKLCKKRKIDVEPKKSQRYYIKKLEDADQAEDDWEDDEDEDDWEDDDE